jgi:methionyl-tRNA synthetase
MIVKYFDSKIPDSKGVSELAGYDWPSIIGQSVSAAIAAADRLDIHAALGEGRSLISKVDAYINATEPFKLAKKIDTESGARDRLAAILYHCAEAVRAASLIMSPAIPEACARLWQSWNCQIPVAHATQTLHHLCEYAGEHALKPGQAIVKGDALFQRADPAEAAPGTPAPDATK